MTYSICARDPDTGAFGVAVASRFFAVGALVPHIRGRSGAIATQAFVNPLWGVEAARRVDAGEAPEAIVADFLARDEGRNQRQFHMIDAQGRIAAHTGGKCVDWAGHVSGPDVSVAGNMLAGPAVVERTLEAFLDSTALPFEERFLFAMEAGEDAGGDKRGKQSACLRIHHGEDYPWLDIRADDHGDPLAELRRLLAVARERFLLVARTMATTDNFSGLIDRREVDEAIQAADAEREARGEPSASFQTGP